MSSGVNMLCFTASFGVALALEAVGLWARPRWRRLAVVVAALAGIVAQTWYLAERAAGSPWAPLSSQHDWCLSAAWGLAIVYLALVLYQPRASIGLFLLPIVLALICAARFASTEPMAGAEMPRIWGILHGVFLMLGTIAVLLGFVAGLMYLVQSARLKNKAPLSDRFRLPSLEWLERVNARSLIAATILVGLGFVTGVLMRLALRDGSGLQWTDPVVISLSGMFSWLVAAEAFRLAYPAARRGRKVAYLTLAGFVFLVITLATFMSSKSMHGRTASSRELRVTSENADTSLVTRDSRPETPESSSVSTEDSR
jgi:ABC-type uncharacterized transport system permease subunit